MDLLPVWVKKENQNGQALLILLLVMAIALTASLSVVSRSVTDITTTTYEEDSTRALSAAEAGVEDVLFSGQYSFDSGATPVAVGTDASYKAKSTVVDAVDNKFVYPVDLSSGDSAMFWLVSQNEDGLLNCGGGVPCYKGNRMYVYWQNDGSNPSLEVTLFREQAAPWGSTNTLDPDYSGIILEKFVFDPGNRILGRNDSFSVPIPPSNQIGDYIFNYRSADLLSAVENGCKDAPGCLVALSVRVIGNANPVRVGLSATVTGSGQLPPQGIKIESLGSSGDSTRKIEVYQSFPAPQSVFDSAIYSYTDIVKN